MPRTRYQPSPNPPPSHWTCEAHVELSQPWYEVIPEESAQATIRIGSGDLGVELHGPRGHLYTLAAKLYSALALAFPDDW